MTHQPSESQNVEAPLGDMPVIRTGLYLRISQDQSGQALGVSRQQEDCEAVAESAGWTVVDIYVDNDISAYKNRPAYNRMLADIKAGKLDAVVAWAPDRLYRRARDLEGLIEIIEQHQILIRTVRAGELDLASAYGRILARILGAIAAGEGEIKSERWKRSWRQHREAGQFATTGTGTFGYDSKGQVVEAERDVVQWMAESVLRGKPILTIARELEAIGVRGMRGSSWTSAAIKAYLTNPRIAGWSTMTRTEPTGRLHVDGSPMMRRVRDIVAEGDWEPLLDRETFEAVRAILTARTRPFVPRKALLGGLLFCGKCGHRMITSGARGKRTYRCPNRPTLRGCGAISGNAEPIEEITEAYARERLTDPRVRKQLAALGAGGSKGPLAELASVEDRIVLLESQLADPGHSLSALMRALDSAKVRQAELADQVSASRHAPLPEVDAPWPTDLLARRGLVELVVERVDLLPVEGGRHHASRLGFDPRRVKVTGR